MKYDPSKIDLGRSLVEGIREFYAPSDVPSEDLFVESISKQQVKIETVGFDRIQQQQRCLLYFPFL